MYLKRISLPDAEMVCDRYNLAVVGIKCMIAVGRVSLICNLSR